MSDYQYKPLDDESIRTLRLLPGEFNDPLRGCIEHRFFFHPRHRGERPGRWVPIYEALSYAWGEQDDLQILSIVNDPTEDESFLRIGKNLSLALRDLRSTSESRTIWCDAVCINQHDLPERAAQVQRMADIYRHADRVVVWLAPHNEQVGRALHLLDEFASHVGYDIDKFTSYTHEGMDETYLRKDYLVPLSSDDWQCVGGLLSLPWFTRLWVRQEITLANDSALLTSGRHQLLWSRFCSSVAYLDLKLYWDETVIRASEKPGMTALFFNATDLINCRSLVGNSFDVIVSMEHCQCSDPLDKIYGVLGLQTDFDMPVEYTKTAKQVYTDWALAYYRKHSKLEFLQLCEIADAPSWAPDLDKSQRLQIGHQRTRSASPTMAVFDVLPDQTFKMLATHCGTITELTTAMPNNLDPEVTREKFKSWIRQLFPRGIQLHDIPKIDELVTAVSGGCASENFDNGVFNAMDGKSALLRDSEQSFPSNPTHNPMDPKLFTELSIVLPGAAVLATKDGHFGVGSGAVHIGDKIFVVLGCRYPIIMRSVEDSKYRVVAPSYFPHLSHGEAVLGQTPDGWKAMFGKNGDLYFVAPDGSRTLEDPRLEEELPPGCKQREGSSGGYLVWKRTEDQNWRDFDPRLTPEKLESRGVKLEMITVV
ncbi:ankyrin and het domain protein [Colletotrichum kahawae]|uniref:Ankyrin and het domain protein n=1 Tax=Colletotrichum kahawae TaxID=34407 RepID=A0AAE0DBW5_COLKA|nr:ankyrin and het domain protein [Colletotrichum kahawae]